MVFGIGKGSYLSDGLCHPKKEDKEDFESDSAIGGVEVTMTTEKSHLERLRIKAKNEIGEKDELIPMQIDQVRALIAEDEAFSSPCQKLDHIILQCLRARKYDVPRAAKMFKKFVIMRNDVSDMADKLKPSVNKELYKRNISSVLTSRDAFGRHILFIRVDRWSPNAFNLDWMLASLFLLLDEAVSTLDTQLHGIVVIVDFKGFGFNHARTARPARIQNIVSILQDSYPVRFKELHFLNHPTLFNMVYALAKPFLKEKMTKRIYFHGHDLTSLHKVISPSILPQTVGGHLHEDEYSDKEILSSLLKKDRYYEEMMQYLLQCNSS